MIIICWLLSMWHSTSTLHSFAYLILTTTWLDRNYYLLFYCTNAKEKQTLEQSNNWLEVSQPRNGRTFHPKTMNFTFFSSAHGTFSRIDHILGHKSSLGKFRKIEIIPSIFSDHNAVRLDLNYKRKTIKNSNIWRLNNTLLNTQ